MFICVILSIEVNAMNTCDYLIINDYCDAHVRVRLELTTAYSERSVTNAAHPGCILDICQDPIIQSTTVTTTLPNQLLYVRVRGPQWSETNI